MGAGNDMRTCSDKIAGVLGSVLAVSGVLASDHAEGLADKRRFTVKDSVEMSYFGTTRSSEPNEIDDDGVTSPDGRYVVKLTHRGVLPEGVTEGTLWLFETAAITRSIAHPEVIVPAPVALARISAAVNGQFNGLDIYDAGNVIFQPQWSEDSRRVTFLGRNGRNNRQIFQVDLSTRHVKALTADTQDVIAYVRSGDTITYFAGTDADLQAKEAWVSAGPGISDVTIGTGIPLMPLLYPHFNGEAFSEPASLELWQVHGGRAGPVLDQRTNHVLRIVTRYDALVLSPSPDATHLATVGYQEPMGTADDQAADPKANPLLQYQVIDLVTGAKEALVNAPIVPAIWRHTGRYRAAWSADGTQIALTETEVPGEHPNTPHGNGPRCTVALVTLASHAVDCVVQPNTGSSALIESLRWNASGDQLVARYKTFDTYDYTTEALQRRGRSWMKVRTSKSPSAAALQLTVHESPNESPILVATDLATGKSRSIFDPNPQLADISLGSVSVYEWKDPQGRVIKGGLVKPPDYVPGRRYPLVIQTHGFDARRFFRVGYSNTANGGRALAARDVIVLQVQEPYSDTESWRDAMGNGTDVYLAAVDQLAAEGIIDPKKVGIAGFSYSGWLVATAITRAPDRFAAAEIANTDPVTLMGYFTHVDSPVGKVEAQAYVGAKPYGAGLQAWVERAPGLATDKITAPVLFQASDPWHLLSFWEMYAGMRDQAKLVELQYIREGQHIIKKPLHQLAHQELLVDWFDFWLNGHEDSAQTKAEQYARWRKLRESSQERQ